MMTFLMIGCGIGLVVLIVLLVTIFFVMQSNERDAVSSAREGWIQRRSERDQDD